MPPVLYTVTADLPNPDLAREYLQWLLGGHAQAVVAAGAQSAAVIRLDPPAPASASAPAVIQVQTQYVFASREAFDHYDRVASLPLRAEGRARFGPDRGVTMRRAVGDILLKA